MSPSDPESKWAGRVRSKCMRRPERSGSAVRSRQLPKDGFLMGETVERTGVPPGRRDAAAAAEPFDLCIDTIRVPVDTRSNRRKTTDIATGVSNRGTRGRSCCVLSGHDEWPSASCDGEAWAGFAGCGLPGLRAGPWRGSLAGRRTARPYGVEGINRPALAPAAPRPALLAAAVSASGARAWRVQVR